MSRVNENEVALAVMRIAATKPNKTCTLDQARAEVPRYLDLSKGDLALSDTREGEPMWHQQIRNIQSHHGMEGNFIYEGLLEHVPRVGYRITNAGEKYLKKS